MNAGDLAAGLTSPPPRSWLSGSIALEDRGPSSGLRGPSTVCPELLTWWASQESVNKRWLSELQPALATWQGRLASGSFTEGRRSSVACRGKGPRGPQWGGVPEGAQAVRFAAPGSLETAVRSFPPSLWLYGATAGGTATRASRSRWRRARSHAGHWRPRKVAAVPGPGAATGSVLGLEAAPPPAGATRGCSPLPQTAPPLNVITEYFLTPPL